MKKGHPSLLKQDSPSQTLWAKIWFLLSQEPVSEDYTPHWDSLLKDEKIQKKKKKSIDEWHEVCAQKKKKKKKQNN